MNKSQKMKRAMRKARKEMIKQWFKNAIAWIKSTCKNIKNYIVRQCNAFWNWLKKIDVVGMVNLTLVAAIVVLLVSLVADFGCRKTVKVNNSADANNMIVANSKNAPKVVNRQYNTTLPLRADAQTGLKPQLRVAGKNQKPMIVKATSVPQQELKQQNLSGDIIVEMGAHSPVLSNGVNIEGNLFIQNMRKYTLPCGATINGNLFIRNVEKLNFCGEFTVTGNIYVNRQSSFGPIPSNAHLGGQVML